MNRRTFIESSLAAAVATAAAPPAWAAAAAHHIDHVGLQLYTVRDLMKQDFDGTIAGVAKIGYTEVEFAGGYFGKSPPEARAALDKNGLTSPSAHTPYAVIEKKLPETLDAAHVIGQKFIVCPYIDAAQRNADGWKRVAELFNRAGETTQKAGIQFAYHNHSFEFEPNEGLGGRLPYDFLLAQTDPKLVKMEMDLCWITVGGHDPVSYFNRHPGRFPLVHVKDWIKEGNGPQDYSGAVGHPVKEGHLANVGGGSIDWKRVFAQSGKAGIQHYFVENDDAKSLDDTRASYEYLAKLQF
jgi:sugar phosphate isomerase/epimerase